MDAPGNAEPLQVDVRGLSLEDRRTAIARALRELRMVAPDLEHYLRT